MISNNTQGKMLFAFYITQRYAEALHGIEKQRTKKHLGIWFDHGRKVERSLIRHLNQKQR